MPPNKLAIQFRLIAFGTPDYQQSLDLRHALLRKPLGLAFEPKQIKEEYADYHLGAFLNDKLIGCMVLSPDNFDTIKFRQMAIDEDYQGLGIGKSLSLKAESIVQAEGYSAVFLHAREHVQGFYEQLGYNTQGDFFTEVTIPHIKMVKKLNDN